MQPTVDLSDISTFLFYREENHADEFVCIVLSRPETEFWDSQVGPNIDYLHHRTGDNLICFLAGVATYGSDAEDAEPIETGRDWGDYSTFSNEKFVGMVAEIEERFWELGRDYSYMGGTELIVASVDNEFYPYNLDFKTAIAIDVEKFIKLGAIPSFTELIERLLKFSKKDLNPRKLTPRRFALEQAKSDPISDLIRGLTRYFGLTTDAFDARHQWITCSLTGKSKPRSDERK